LTIPSNLWLYLIISYSHPSVLCFRRPLNSGLFPGDPSSLLILWFCKLANPSLPTLLCFHLDHPLVITSNVWFILGPSSFHSSNLCLYPTIHSSSHLIYICIRTFPSASSPVGVFTRAISSTLPIPYVCIRIILSLFTLYIMCLFHLFSLYPVIVAGQSPTRQLCLCIYTAPSLSPVFEPSNVDFYFLCFSIMHFYPDHSLFFLLP